MANILIDLVEVKRLKLSLKEYLALLDVNGIISYSPTKEDIEGLKDKGWIIFLPDNIPILSPKSKEYFESKFNFERFYTTFPHRVPGRYGKDRPLRSESINTLSASTTRAIYKNKTRGNKTLQEHILKVLEAEIKWRTEEDTLSYMNNIDTWLRQHKWEDYAYLLEEENNNNKILL